MNAETLESLVVDRELGELSPEAVELLDAYLRIDPAARADAALVAEAVRLARTALHSFPGLVAAPRSVPLRTFRWRPGLARAAAAVLLLGAGLGVGRWTGRAGRAAPGGAPASARAAGRDPSVPWARYQVAFDARSGAYAVAPVRDRRSERP